MTYASLYSGGKDSTLALWMAQKDDINVGKLVTVCPKREDSYMFHKPNLHLVPKLAESIDIELIRVKTEGVKERELDDLRKTVSSLNIEGLITGAVASEYQKDRIERIAKDFGLKVYSPLWGMDQEKILKILIKNNFDARIVSVAAMGLDKNWLGRKIDKKCIQKLMNLKKRYRINVAGEGGEYETLVLGGPNFKYDFKIVNSKKNWDGKRGTLNVEEIERV